jgi:hypothetical protein
MAGPNGQLACFARNGKNNPKGPIFFRIAISEAI